MFRYIFLIIYIIKKVDAVTNIDCVICGDNDETACPCNCNHKMGNTSMMPAISCDNQNIISLAKEQPFTKVNNAKTLILNHNNLTIIENGVFDMLNDSLQYLFLEWNNIKTIEGGSLDIPNLDRLELRYNNIEFFEPHIFDKLQKLRVTHMQWNQLNVLFHQYAKHIKLVIIM